MATRPSTTGSSRPAQIPPLLQQAAVVHQAGQLEAAEPLYRRFLAENPEHPAALQLFGLLRHQRGEHDAAIALMAKSLRLFREQPEVYNNMGNALAACGRMEEAVKSYSQAIGLRADYGDAWRNLGLSLLELNRPEDAAKSFARCLEINDADAAAWVGLGNAYRSLDRVDEAISCQQRALQLRPDYAQAHHNMGVCLTIKRRPEAAVSHFESARRLGLDKAEVYQNMGTALVDMEHIGPAIDAYREAIARNPEDVSSHHNLNTLLWEQEQLDHYLLSYKDALARLPASVPLRTAYATALNRMERFDDAERVLAEGMRLAPQDSDIKSQLAYTLENQSRWAEALRMHEAAVSGPSAKPAHNISMARALLACGRPEQALVQADTAIRQTPLNQLAIAYRGLCWRLLGDERDDVLNDYDRFVQVFDIPLPKGYSSTEEFNERLIAVLNTLHTGKLHPPEQTLRGGTQTHGDLFGRGGAEIDGLVESLNQCINEYIGSMSNDMEHPLLSRRSDNFGFSGSWSVKLRRCGFHTMHVHPMGWISSAYYVDVPPEVSGSEASGGGIKFGQPDIDLGSAGAARRAIQPVAGRLVLFPSYMWHGTVPHDTEGDRITVAFDVVPKSGSPSSSG